MFVLQLSSEIGFRIPAPGLRVVQIHDPSRLLPLQLIHLSTVRSTRPFRRKISKIHTVNGRKLARIFAKLCRICPQKGESEPCTGPD